MKWIELYSDGSTYPGNPGSGGYGAVILFPNRIKWEVYGGRPRTTNNVMELYGALRGLYALDRGEYHKVPIYIYSDSMYIIRGMTEWHDRWIDNGWRTGANNPVRNKHLWVKLIGISKSFEELHWSWVRGHDNDKFNIEADHLAGIAAKLTNENRKYWEQILKDRSY